MKNIIMELRILIADKLISMALSIYPNGERKIDLATHIKEFYKASLENFK